jgi:hypothetical protein
MLSWIAANPILFAAVAFTAVVVFWIARPYVRELLIGLAGAPARVARGASIRLRAEARRIDVRYKARVREHLRQELEERLSRQARQLEGRLQADINRADATLMKLRDTADGVIQAADNADPTKVADRIILEIQDGEVPEKGGRSGALARAQTRLEAAVRESRAYARSLKPEARRIISATDKLRLIEHKLSRHAHDMNDAADRYERLLLSEERGKGAGDASIVVPWVAALVVIAIAAAGAVLNFQLLERPMSELVGGGARLAGLPLAALAAITLILLEAAAGIVLMEAAGATRLLPVFSRMSGRMLVGFTVAALFFLCVFSVVEVALAFTREAILALDAEVLRAAAGETAEATEAAATSSLPVALIAQALLGFAIPWVLAVVAIPAETVINNTRFIVEALWKQTLSFTAFLLAALGTLLRAASQGLMAVYDLAIFPALAAQGVVRRLARRKPADDELEDEPAEPIAPPRSERLRPVNGRRAKTAPAPVVVTPPADDLLPLSDQRVYANGTPRP